MAGISSAPGAARSSRGHHGSGNIVAYDYVSFEPPNTDLETSAQLTAITLATETAGADTTNSAGMAMIPNRRVTAKSLPILNGYLKTAPLRSPGAPQSAGPRSR